MRPTYENSVIFKSVYAFAVALGRAHFDRILQAVETAASN